MCEEKNKFPEDVNELINDWETNQENEYLFILRGDIRLLSYDLEPLPSSLQCIDYILSRTYYLPSNEILMNEEP